MESTVAFNAFRVLSLSGDAEMTDVYRQQRRLQIALELGDAEPLPRFKFLRPLALGTEMLLEAVHRLERQRLLEELFWVHDLGGKIDLNFADPDGVLNALRSDAKLNTTRGAVAQHNLAIVSLCLALECSTEAAFDHWHEALSWWTKTFSNRVFWDFIQDRAESARPTEQELDLAPLQIEAKKKIQQLVNDQLWKAVSERNGKAIARFTELAITHAALVHSDLIITEVANQLINDGTAELGTIGRKVTAVAKDGDPEASRAILVTAERDTKRIYETTASVLRALTAESAAAVWSDAKASALGRLSVAYFNSLDDTNESLRLVAEARQSAHDPRIRERMERDWQYVQRSLLCSEAMTLISSGNFDLAEQKLAGALALSTDEQKQEVQELLEACHRARVFHGVDTSKKSPTLSTINGIGAAFWGKRDFDQVTKTYITNHWFVLLFIPIIPIGSYRVSDGNQPGSYYIHGRVPLSPLLKKWRWGVVAAILLLIIYANVDFGTNSSPLATSSQSSPTSVSPSSPSTSEPPAIYRQSSSFNTPSDSSDFTERESIETERAELQQLRKSLDERQNEMDTEETALNSMKSYIRSVQSEYTAENIPEDVRLQYDSTLSSYNSRVPEYNRSLESLKSDLRTFEQRVRVFNARVNRYNANR